MVEVVTKLVDILTGEIIGYRYKNDEYSAVVSEKKALELNLQDAKILGYIDLPSEEAYTYLGKYYLCDMIEREINCKQDLRDFAGTLKGQCTGCAIDNDIAITRMVTGEEPL